jgi:hypothetical protein
MLFRRHAILGALAAGTVALGLSGCGSMHMHHANMAHLGAQLSGSQEVPAKAVPGNGTAEVAYDKDTHMLHYKVSYSGLTGPVTGAHIHGPAAPGNNAGVLVPFKPGPSPITGEAKLTPAQAGDLLAGLYYVNLHTPAKPAGEIRGQLQLKR